MEYYVNPNLKDPPRWKFWITRVKRDGLTPETAFNTTKEADDIIASADTITINERYVFVRKEQQDC